LKKRLILGNLVDSPTQRVGESFFDYEYLHEFEAKVGTAQMVVKGIYAEPIYAKTRKIPFIACLFKGWEEGRGTDI
jgi:hypothetical protein